MSYQDFKKAMALAPQCRFYEVDEGISEEVICRAEEILGFQFSKQSREFYKNHNYLSFYGNEIYGILPDEPEVLVGNSVGYALKARKEYGLPREWLPLCDNGDDGCVVFADYSELNAEDEPRIIEALYSDEWYDQDVENEQITETEASCKYRITEVLADDFGEFLLGLVEKELAEQKAEAEHVSNAPLSGTQGPIRTLADIEAELDKMDAVLAEVQQKIDRLLQK